MSGPGRNYTEEEIQTDGKRIMRKSNKEYNRKWRIENREKTREYNRKYRAENLEKTRECARKYRAENPEKTREYDRKYRAANPERVREYDRKYRAANPEKIRESARKYRANNSEKIRESSKKWQTENPEKVKAAARKWRAKNPDATKKWKAENPERVKAAARKWKAENPEKVSKQNKKDLKTFREKNRNNPIYKMHQNMRSAMSAALRGRYKALSTMKIIGCTVEELFEHLEACTSWEPWMTRERYGAGGWDVDHIIPIAKWDDDCPLQFALCWDKSNLQPLEHIANIKKGAA